MPAFSVIVTRDVTESVALVVTARNGAEAEARAREEAELNPNLDWALDDGNFYQPYTNGADEIEMPVFKTRADLMHRRVWQDLDTDTAGNPCVWENHYPSGFVDEWSCQCDNEDESPEHSEWIGPLDAAEIALWESLPDAY